MIKKMLILVFALAAMAAAISAASENRGAEEILLDGGSRGAVPFPHLRHQAKLGDCQVCHALFPQEKGSIDKLKASGDLVKKQIMNLHCVKCHRTEKRAGKASGPTACSQCHRKD